MTLPLCLVTEGGRVGGRKERKKKRREHGSMAPPGEKRRNDARCGRGKYGDGD